MIYIDDDIYRLTEDEVLASIQALPPQRRESLMKYRHDLGRRQGLLAYLLLYKGLKEEYGLTDMPTFEFSEHGKPTLSGHPDIHFNLSHCKTAVACAISNKPIGIDIESIREGKEAVVRYAMNESEASLIRQAKDPDREFTRLWTRKEAYLKLLGTGITDNMKDVLTDCPAQIETTVTDHYIVSVARMD